MFYYFLFVVFLVCVDVVLFPVYEQLITMNISNQRMKLNSEYITNCVCIMVHWFYLNRQFTLTGQCVFIIFAIYGH